MHRAVPAHFNDPVGLALRLARSGPDARFSMFLAGLSLAAAPVDALLAARERRLYHDADAPQLPILVVCGPARSGTSVVARTIARALPVAFFTNITGVFPNSPIVASRLFRAYPRGELLNLRSHYGRSSGFHGWNDGLHFWDRWLGGDRTSVRSEIDPERGQAMVRFLGAFERWTGRPLATKNNNLIAHASQVARYLPSVHFVCLDRDPLFLAQSLLRARAHIHGDTTKPYGLHKPSQSDVLDPVADVCNQVRFYQSLAARQLAELGPERFRILGYGEFCRDPGRIIRTLASDVLRVPVDETRIPDRLEESRTQLLPDEEFRRLRREFDSGNTA